MTGLWEATLVISLFLWAPTEIYREDYQQKYTFSDQGTCESVVNTQKKIFAEHRLLNPFDWTKPRAYIAGECVPSIENDYKSRYIK